MSFADYFHFVEKLIINKFWKKATVEELKARRNSISLVDNSDVRQSRPRDRKFATLRGFRKASKPSFQVERQEVLNGRVQS